MSNGRRSRALDLEELPDRPLHARVTMHDAASVRVSETRGCQHGRKHETLLHDEEVVHLLGA